jgi:hypothetical protein
VFTASAVSKRKGGFVAEILASADFNASRKRSSRASARARVKLVATNFACALSLVAAYRVERRLRSTINTAQSSHCEHPASKSCGLARPAAKARLRHPRVCGPKLETRHSLRAAR